GRSSVGHSGRLRHRVALMGAKLGRIGGMSKKARSYAGLVLLLAERVGFEPTVRRRRTPDFESGAFDHSATSPVGRESYGAGGRDSSWQGRPARLVGSSQPPQATPMAEILVPVSYGELLDKIAILRIKSERMRDPANLANVRRELEALERTW